MTHRSLKFDELRAFFQQNADYHFSTLKCRAVGINLIEARFLKQLALAKRCNQWVFANFGAGKAYQLLQHGWVANPLGKSGNAHTNIWQLTEQGIDTLSSIMNDADTDIPKNKPQTGE